MSNEADVLNFEPSSDEEDLMNVEPSSDEEEEEDITLDDDLPPPTPCPDDAENNNVFEPIDPIARVASSSSVRVKPTPSPVLVIPTSPKTLPEGLDIPTSPVFEVPSSNVSPPTKNKLQFTFPHATAPPRRKTDCIPMTSAQEAKKRLLMQPPVSVKTFMENSISSFKRVKRSWTPPPPVARRQQSGEKKSSAVAERKTAVPNDDEEKLCTPNKISSKVVVVVKKPERNKISSSELLLKSSSSVSKPKAKKSSLHSSELPPKSSSSVPKPKAKKTLDSSSELPPKPSSSVPKPETKKSSLDSSSRLPQKSSTDSGLETTTPKKPRSEEVASSSNCHGDGWTRFEKPSSSRHHHHRDRGFSRRSQEMRCHMQKRVLAALCIRNNGFTLANGSEAWSSDYLNSKKFVERILKMNVSKVILTDLSSKKMWKELVKSLDDFHPIHKIESCIFLNKSNDKALGQCIYCRDVDCHRWICLRKLSNVLQHLLDPIEH